MRVKDKSNRYRRYKPEVSKRLRRKDYAQDTGDISRKLVNAYDVKIMPNIDFIKRLRLCRNGHKTITYELLQGDVERLRDEHDRTTQHRLHGVYERYGG
jgi:hypothetical protein